MLQISMKTIESFIPLKEDHRFANNFINLEGLRCNRVVLGKLIGHTPLPYAPKKRRPIYEALCDCGNKFMVRGADVKSGYIKSCGCFKKEQTIVFNKKTKTKVAYCTFSSVWQSYKSGAKNRNLSFELDKDTFFKLTQSNCYYCGQEPSQQRKPREKNKLNSYIYNGIDRVDSSKGYLKENCVTCCGRCNYMKMDYNLDDFKEHVIKIYNNFFNK